MKFNNCSFLKPLDLQMFYEIESKITENVSKIEFADGTSQKLPFSLIDVFE